MSAFRPSNNRIVRHAALLASGFAVISCAIPVAAQEIGAIRGSVDETSVTGSILDASTRATSSNGIPSGQYVPGSAGAVPDDEATRSNGQSLFAQDGAENPFADAPTPRPAVRSSTAARFGRPARQSAVAARRQNANGAGTSDTSATNTDDTPTGTVRAGRIEGDLDLRTSPASEPAEPTDGLDPVAGDNPYAPIGIRAGSFTLRPSIESGVTWTSNTDYSSSGSPAFLSETTLRVNAASDWDRHSASVDAYGTFRKSFSGAPLDERIAGIDARFNLDLDRDYRALAALGYAVAPESASSPVTIVGSIDRPLRHTLTGRLGLEKSIGKMRLGITGNVERDIYSDADLSTGGVLSQRDRNSTLGTLVLRGGYEISPALTPFVEAEIGRRYYELRQDSSGFARSSDRVGARAGIELDLGEKLSGELSAGWIREKFDDPRLPAISGATLDAALAWSPMRGTIVRLNGSTTVEGSTTPAESGSILYATGVNVEREMRANLTGNVGLGVAYRNYTGSSAHDTTLRAEAGMTYWFNRYAGLIGRVRHERQTSNLAGRDYKINSVFLGMRFQR